MVSLNDPNYGNVPTDEPTTEVSVNVNPPTPSILPGETPPVVIEPVPIKPGWQSSEFWMVLVVMLLSAMVQFEVFPTGSPEHKWITIALFVLAGLGYSGGRSIVKSFSGPRIFVK